MRPPDEPLSSEPPLPPNQEAGTAARAHLVVLIPCVGMLLAAVLLTPSSENLQFGPLTLPSLCLLRNTTGIPCPGCGLTRSVVYAVHGEWKCSFQVHRLGLLVVGYVILQTLYRLAWMGLPLFRAHISRVGRLVDWTLIPLMALLLINWVPTLITTARKVL